MWIESHQSLRNHPKIKKAARLAGINEFEMIGRLHCLWWWALDYAPDGDLTNYSDDDIEAAVDWSGKRGIFANAMIECGFNGHGGLIDVSPDSRCIHDWFDYAGKLVERRAANADRMREARALHVQRTSRASAGLPNLTKPNLTKPNQPDKQKDGADKPRTPLTTTQQKVLDSFKAKRFKNDIQRDAVLAWEQYPDDSVSAAIVWAATKGFALGQAIENITRALPKWNTPKPNGNGNGRHAAPESTGSPMMDAILKAQQEPGYGK